MKHEQVPSLKTSTSNCLVSIHSAKTQFVIDAKNGQCPRIVYFGKRLHHAQPAELDLLSTRQWAHGGPSIALADSLSNELSSGLNVAAGFIAHRAGEEWGTIFKTVKIDQKSNNSFVLMCHDESTQIGIDYHFRLDPETHILSSKSAITNLSTTPLTIDWCAPLSMPLDNRLSRLKGFSGRWAMEFQSEGVETFQGHYVRENRSGRTSHNNFPGLIALSDMTSESAGPAAGFHLGWSGNSRTQVEHTSDGRSYLQMGELFHPQEIELSANECYETPTLYSASSEEGLNGVSQQFHTHLLTRILDKRTQNKSRLVHYNSWEAIYFDHDEEKLFSLAKKAAELGAERFILDDGWFGGRRNDHTGLGDWWVSQDVYPKGLKSFVDHVKKLGMEMGIWFEPEMVNPDSDLFRAHPDWVLQLKNVRQVPFRNQYALNLTQVEVFDYLFKKMSDIIKELNIDYIKWDMNRDIHHPSSNDSGRGIIHQQTKAVYALIDKIRTQFPSVEIESCSSGGARCDFGILKRTDRLWVSDSNDALDRQRIQRGGSYFFPLAVMGAHVGPKKCHITQREFNMEFRAATAMFGHMGMELDLFEESQSDLNTLKSAISLYKEHRQLIHSGSFVRLQMRDHYNGIGVISKDKSKALFSVAKLTSEPKILPERLRFDGLDGEKKYQVRLIWPKHDISVTSPSIIEAADLIGDGRAFSGEALCAHGMQLPLVYPQTCLIYHLEITQ